MIDVIITKQTVSEGFYIVMRGHRPNEKFKNILTNRIATYKEAYEQANILGRTVSLLGNEVRLLNDKYAEVDAKAFCDHMAFIQFETDTNDA